MRSAIATASASVDKDVSYVRSSELTDPSWDKFLERTGGHHTQSTRWAALKRGTGWRALRIVATRGEIVGGVQVLVKSTHRLSIAYVTRGPALAENSALAAGLIQEAKSFAASEGAMFVLAQPPASPESLPADLGDHGFHASPVWAGPRATTIVDLTASEDEILARMKQKTRYNIRLAERKGVLVREGTAQDLPTLHRLIAATAARQGFTDYPVEYFEQLTSVFGLGDGAPVFIAEVDGEPVSAHLGIRFGETYYYKKGGWSGTHGKYHANEAIQWAAMRWARERGCLFYDMEGIDAVSAELVLSGEPLPKDGHPLTRFKLGFGGEVAMLPGTYDWANGRLAWAMRRAGTAIAERPWLGRLTYRIRGIEA